MKTSYLISIALIVLALMGSYLIVRDDKGITNHPSNGTNIIAFGDSLVAGYGSEDGGDFVSLLSKIIKKPIINLGKSGDTTKDGLLRIDEVLRRDPKVVIVLFGGNDFLKKIPEEETFSNLAIIIEKIQDEGAIVILLGVQGGAIFDKYNENYEDLAKEYGTFYVKNILEDIIGRPKLMFDIVHPNNKGYKIIAYRIQSVLEESLNEN